MAFILTAIFVSLVVLFGFFCLFVNAENVERNILVGGLTLLTAVIAAGLLVVDANRHHPEGTAGLVSICALSLLGYGVGRVIDRILGPTDHTVDSKEGTLGADLAD